MTPQLPWRSHLLRASILFLAILIFQYVARGELTLAIAVPVVIAYVFVAEGIRRYGDRWTQSDHS